MLSFDLKAQFMRFRVFPVAIISLALCLASLTAQQSAPSAGAPAQNPPNAPGDPAQSPTFRSRIDAVTVDAVVTDKQGHAVTDLTADDFEIIENKKPQTVQTFKLIKIDDTERPDSSFVHDITSIDEQQRETARDDQRILVIFLDDYHVRVGNSLVVKQELAKFVKQLTPNDLVAVMYPLTSVNALTFSRNHDQTASTVSSFLGRKYNYTPTNDYEERVAEYPPEAQEQVRLQITLTALRGLAAYLGTLREGRKQVLYVSEGLSGTLPPGIRTKGQTIDTARPQATDSQRFFNQMDVLSQMELVFSAAARSNTSIYTLDPRGLAPFDSPVNNDFTTLAEDRVNLNEQQESLRILAANTDGRAIVNRNDPVPDMKRMMSDMSAYYLLGYTSTEAPRDGKFHPITVRVKRKDVEVRARKGYWAYTAEDAARALAPAGEGVPAAVENALSTLAVPRDHAVRTWVGSQRGANGAASVTFAWERLPPRGPAVPPRADDPDVVDHVTLTATSNQGDVLFRGNVPRDPSASLPEGRIRFDAPPGTVHLLIVAENAKGSRIDHDESAVEIPDFTGAGPILSAPTVFRGRTARDMQQIRAADDPIPVVTREFPRTDRLLVRFQAYAPGGTVPQITLRLLNNLGKKMSDLPAPTRLPDGTFELEIGLGPLAQGDYLIEIDAAAGDAHAQSLLPVRVAG
jgi:VWFA-related protein